MSDSQNLVADFLSMFLPSRDSGLDNQLCIRKYFTYTLMYHTCLKSTVVTLTTSWLGRGFLYCTGTCAVCVDAGWLRCDHAVTFFDNHFFYLQSLFGFCWDQYQPASDNIAGARLCSAYVVL